MCILHTENIPAQTDFRVHRLVQNHFESACYNLWHTNCIHIKVPWKVLFILPFYEVCVRPCSLFCDILGLLRVKKMSCYTQYKWTLQKPSDSSEQFLKLCQIIVQSPMTQKLVFTRSGFLCWFQAKHVVVSVLQPENTASLPSDNSRLGFDFCCYLLSVFLQYSTCSHPCVCPLHPSWPACELSQIKIKLNFMA